MLSIQAARQYAGASGLPKRHWYSLRRMTYAEYSAMIQAEHDALVEQIVKDMKERNEQPPRL